MYRVKINYSLLEWSSLVAAAKSVAAKSAAKSAVRSAVRSVRARDVEHNVVREVVTNWMAPLSVIPWQGTGLAACRWDRAKIFSSITQTSTEVPRPIRRPSWATHFHPPWSDPACRTGIIERFQMWRDSRTLSLLLIFLLPVYPPRHLRHREAGSTVEVRRERGARDRRSHRRRHKRSHRSSSRSSSRSRSSRGSRSSRAVPR
jgi:hypothetical protein